MNKKSILALVLCLVISAGLLSGCKGKYAADATAGSASPTTYTEESPTKDTLTIAIGMEPTCLDPQNTNKQQYWSIIGQIYDTLIIENDDGTYSPGLATEWELTDDTTMKITLRDDVTFHNGEKLTANDVLYTFARGKTTAISKSTFDFFDEVNSYAEDDTHVVLKLNYPYAPIYNTLSSARGNIVCKSYVEKMGDDLAGREPIGTGPYQFVSWTTGTELDLTSNDSYWGQVPKTKNLVWKFITEDANRAIELETGNADIAWDINTSDVDGIDNTNGTHMEMTDSPRYMTFTCSMQDQTLQNQDLRYALAYAIDRQAIVDAVYGKTATVATGYCTPGILGYKEYDFEYDLDKAKEYYEKAGYSGQTLKFKIVYDARNIDRKIVEAVQNMWGKLGVSLECYEMDSATYKSQGNSFQVGLRAGTVNEPSNIFIIYDSAFGDKLQPNDDWIDARLKDAKAIYDTSERAAAYQELTDYLDEKKWTVPIVYTKITYGVSDKVTGFDCDPCQRPDLEYVQVYE